MARKRFQFWYEKRPRLDVLCPVQAVFRNPSSSQSSFQPTLRTKRTTRSSVVRPRCKPVGATQHGTGERMNLHALCGGETRCVRLDETGPGGGVALSGGEPERAPPQNVHVGAGAPSCGAKAPDGLPTSPARRAPGPLCGARVRRQREHEGGEAGSHPARWGCGIARR